MERRRSEAEEGEQVTGPSDHDEDLNLEPKTTASRVRAQGNGHCRPIEVSDLGASATGRPMRRRLAQQVG